jgi:replication factor C subunit 2/4
MTTKRSIIYNSLPWVTKYQPPTIDSVNIDSLIKKQIEKMINNKYMPNIILVGPPGVGKTSTVRCVAKDMYHKYYNHMVLEMNASDDRGIKVQETINNFLKVYVHINDDDKKNVAPFKLVILDEADNMTDKAKHIIAAFLKHNNDTLRFAFTCNSKVNIIPAIQSSCHIIKYPPLSTKIIKKRLQEICHYENIINTDTDKKTLKIIKKGIDAISTITNGDMRKSINMLQLTYNRFNVISEQSVYEIYDKPHPSLSKEIIIDCCNENIGPALQKIINMRNQGYSGTDIALGLMFALRNDICNDIPIQLKIEFMKNISYAVYNISKGLESSMLQISACVGDMCFTAKRLTC